MKRVFIGALAALLLSSAQVVDRSPVIVSAISAPIAASAQKDCVPQNKVPPRIVPKNSPPNSTGLNTGLPPLRYQGPANFYVRFVSPEEADKICSGVGKPICGLVFYACRTDKNQVYMPNPCHQKYAGEKYASTMCHEKGHVNGWPWYHGD